MSSKICVLCSQKVGIIREKIKCADGFICSKCYKNLGFPTCDY